jgi:hypothetical protein
LVVVVESNSSMEVVSIEISSLAETKAVNIYSEDITRYGRVGLANKKARTGGFGFSRVAKIDHEQR